MPGRDDRGDIVITGLEPGFQGNAPGRGDVTVELGGNYSGDGLRVMLNRIQGVTKKDILDNPLRFQCPPMDEFAFQGDHAHTDYDTIRGKQFSRRSVDQLIVLDFTTLHTIDPYPWVLTDENWDPRHTGARLFRIKKLGTPVQLTAWHAGQKTDPELDMAVTLRSVRQVEKAGEIDARYFDLSFVQWRDGTVKRRRKGQHGGGHDNWPKTHHIDHNDTLHSLAVKYYHQPTGAHHIGRSNGGLAVWGANTRIMNHPDYDWGDKVKIPAPQGRHDNEGAIPDEYTPESEEQDD